MSGSVIEPATTILPPGCDRHARGGGRNVVAEAGEDLAAGAEGGVQPAAGVVARHGEVLEEVVAAVEARDRPRHHDPAVRIDGHARGGGRRIAAEVGQDLAADAEGSVQAAVLVVPRQDDLLDELAVGEGSRHHDLAIGLDRHAHGLNRAVAEVGEDRAVGAEVGVHAAVGVEARQGEVPDDAAVGGEDGGRPHLDDLAIGLDRLAGGDVAGRARDVGDDLASGAEAPVQAAIGAVTGHAEPRDGAAAEGERDRPRRDDLAVGLDGDARPGGPRPGAEVGEDLAAGAEVGVEPAGDGVARQREILEEIAVAVEARGRPRHDDLAVAGLDGDARGRARGAGRGGGDDLTAGAEARIEAAVAGLVPRQGEVSREARRVLDRPRHDDGIGAGLQGDARDGGHVEGAEAGEDLAAGAEDRCRGGRRR